MARTIDIDPGEVSRAAEKVRSAARNISDSAKTFEHIEGDIEDSWKSRYTSQYISIIDDTYLKVRKTASRLMETANSLDRIAAAVRKAEEELQRELARSGGGGSVGGGSGGGGGSSY